MFETQITQELASRLDRVEAFSREELMGIRTGKASPALVENIIVSVYDNTTKLSILELATVATAGPSHLTISPFDPATVQDIEKAILSSPLHLTPRVEGKLIHITVPALSEEQRREFMKLISAKIEEGRVKIRGARDDMRKKVKATFETKEITEDDKFRIEKKLDEVSQEYTKKLDELKEKKEKEIMEV